jgi:DnaJ like chaperone protein
LIDRSGVLAGTPDRSVVFTTGLVALSAKMARSDGVVTGDEVAAFRRIVRADDDDMPRIERLFDLAKGATAGYEAYAAQIADLFRDDAALLEDILDGLFMIAAADGVLHEAERRYLRAVTDIFGLSERFDRIEARHVVRKDDPFRILGVDPRATDPEIRKAWLALVAELHPDKAVARGLPPEAVSLAQERLAVINAAYERLQADRRAIPG